MRNCVYVFAVWLVLAGTGCGVRSANVSAEADKPVASQTAKKREDTVVIPVQAELPRRGDISSHFETTTRVDAENRVQVVAEGVGECVKVLAQEGDRVKAGQILAELDKTEALAMIGQTEVHVRQSKTALDIAEKSLAEGIGAKAERDNAQFAHEQALATLNMQKVNLDRLTIKAPISGIITRKNIQEGQVVATGVPVFSIVDPASFMLVIAPPEKELARLQVGQIAKVKVDALGEEEFEATVRRINPGVDPLTGTVKVTLDFDPGTREKLREAAFCRVRLVMETHANALLVPKDAVVEENARKYLFIVEPAQEESESEAADKPAENPAAPPAETAEDSLSDATDEASDRVYVATRVEVQTGLEDANSVEILSGANDNSLIVTLGQHTLKSGSHVRMTNATDEILSKAGLSAEEALKIAKEKRANEEPSAAPASKKRLR